MLLAELALSTNCIRCLGQQRAVGRSGTSISPHGVQSLQILAAVSGLNPESQTLLVGHGTRSNVRAMYTAGVSTQQHVRPHAVWRSLLPSSGMIARNFSGMHR